jgi:uracil-DNA glycosylase
MSPRTQAEELLSLTKETREYVSFLGELGVENFEGQTTEAVSVIAEVRGPAVEEPSQLGTQRNYPAMARRISPKKPDSATPADTLFGDIFQKPEDRLPDSAETFEEIWADIGNCTRCPLCHDRTNVVHTEGNRKARLMFVGEAPGADEDAQARPFVGRAGQLLTKIIEALGLRREEVLIGNVNRCRPPGNRAPTQEEASMCKPFLLREIAAARPDVIVVLGNTAIRNLLDTREGVTRLRGQFQNYKGIKVMPTFHPAYLLRDPSKKRETWDDLKKVRDYLDSKASTATRE